MPSRDATSRWQGDLLHGKGSRQPVLVEAGVFDVSFPTRAAGPDGQTSPEELLAAAHSSCLNLTATVIDVSVEVTLGPATGGGFEISGIAIVLRAELDGVDAARFRELATVAEQTCPISKALAGTTITLDAALTS
jgi:osmotically inducible protein OsmC